MFKIEDREHEVYVSSPEPIIPDNGSVDSENFEDIGISVMAVHVWFYFDFSFQTLAPEQGFITISIIPQGDTGFAWGDDPFSTRFYINDDTHAYTASIPLPDGLPRFFRVRIHQNAGHEILVWNAQLQYKAITESV